MELYMEEVPKEDTNLKDKQMDGLVISLSDVESLRWASPWLNTLVMNVLNKWVSFRTLEAKLQRSWTRNRSIQIIDLHEGFYQVVFSNHGWWRITTWLHVQRLRPFFLMHAKKTKKIAVWIRIQRLPIEIYNDIFL